MKFGGKMILLSSLPTSQQQEPATRTRQNCLQSGKGQQSARSSRESKHFYILQ